MTSFDRFERSLPALFDDLALPRVPDYFDDLVAQTAATRQRPGWTFPERWLLMSALTRTIAGAPRIPWRFGVVVALLALAALIVALASGSLNQRVPEPFGPAANGGLAYASGGDIYVGDAGAGTSRLLVGGSENDRHPLFSPDGTHVAFVRDESGSGGLLISLFVVRADGAGLTRITPQPLRDADTPWLSWTPDSGRLAVAHTVDGMNQLDLLDATGNGAAHRLTAAAGIDALQYRPPDGNEIMFRACLNQSTAGRSNCGLYVMDADGSNVRQLAQPATDGDTLDLTNAVYSADGSHIIYNRWTADASFGSPGCCHLFVMKADGSDQRHFVPNDGSGVWDGVAVASPDGKLVAFIHNSNNGVSIVRSDGTGPIIQTGPAFGSSHWLWAPDSSKILLVTDGDPNAKLLDPGGGPWTQLPWRSDSDLDWQRLAK